MVYKSLLLLGRQPALGRAELESLLGAKHLERIGDQAMAADVLPEGIDFDRLGGSLRLAEVIAVVSTIQWPEIMRALAGQLSTLLNTMPPDGKIKLGLSCVGLPTNVRQLFRSGLDLKKQCKQLGHSIRLVPNTELALSTAQVLHNQLTGDLGIELLLVRNGATTIVTRTTAVQNITAYARRDQGRPKRDARVGMLPPKLAQIIVNLAAGTTLPNTDYTVLDPFCGTGVVLQEALLMGYNTYGTDLELRMIDFTTANLEWLRTQYPNLPGHAALSTGDATDFQWQERAVSAVASETYLGRPLSAWPKPETLRDIMGTCNLIIEKFLRNLGSQIAPGTRLCLALPAWRSPQGRIHRLQLLDRLTDLGYNRISFEHVREDDLVYFRPDQLVARQLLVITRN